MLIQESLAQIGIKTTINKMPGSNWRSEMAKKTMPMMVNFFSGWLDYPEYFFFWCYSGQNAIFNTIKLRQQGDGCASSMAPARPPPSMTRQICDKTWRASSPWPGTTCRAYRCIQPHVKVAMQQNISGYCYWFHRQVDYRSLVKA